MSDRISMRSIARVSMLTVCSALAVSPVFAAGFPVGSYQVKDLTLSFDDKGQFHVNMGETTEVSGTYSVKGGRIDMTDVKGPWACTESGQQTGSYKWKLDGAVLTFSKVADSCDARSGTLVPVAWKSRK